MATSLLRLPPALRQQIWTRCIALGVAASTPRPWTSLQPLTDPFKLGDHKGYATVYPTDKDDIWNDVNNRKKPPPGDNSMSNLHRILEAARNALDAHTSVSALEKAEVLCELRHLIADIGFTPQDCQKLHDEVGEKFSDEEIVRSLQEALSVINPTSNVGSDELDDGQLDELSEDADGWQSVVFLDYESSNEELMELLAKKYPSAPSELFDPEKTVNVLNRDAARRGHPIRFKTVYSKCSDQICTIQPADNTKNCVFATANGQDRTSARDAACTKLLSSPELESALREIYYLPQDTSYPGQTVPPQDIPADQSYIRKLLQVPTTDQYSRVGRRQPLKVSGVVTPSLILSLKTACWRQNLTAELKWSGKNFIRSTFTGYELSISIPGVVEVSAAGEGQDQTAAILAAEVHLLGKLHAQEILQQLFSHRLETPSPEQYPHAPKGLFSQETVAQEMSNLRGNLRAPAFNVKASIDVVVPGEISACDLEVEIPGHFSVSVKGEGATGKSAKKNAWLQVVAHLHANGTLARLFPDPSNPVGETEAIPADEEVDQHEGGLQPKAEEQHDEEQQEEQNIQDPEDGRVDAAEDLELSSETIRAERNAKTEIYNFAAGLGLVPEFEVESMRPRTLKERRKARSGHQKSSLVVSARLPEMGIEVQGVGKDVHAAEIDASVKFKRMAETKMTKSQLQPDQNYYVLNADTGSKFFDFLRFTGKRADLELEHEQVQIDDVALNKIRLTVNDEIEQTVTMSTKAEAVAIAHLAAAVIVATKEPTWLQEFSNALQKGKGNIFKSLRPIKVPLDNSTLNVMRSALVEARRSGLPDIKEELAPEEELEQTAKRRRKDLSTQERRRLSRDLQAKAQSKLAKQKLDTKTSQQLKEMLPMTQHSTEVLDLVSQRDYSIIIGATGSGKTTQVPQIILDDAIRREKGGFCDIICTQPRRLAASSVAQRVAAEREEQLQQSVGYHVRFDAKLPRSGASITYCTTGIFLEQLKRDPEVLSRVSHVVLDEVHERDLQSDMLMILLKRAIKARREAQKPIPKVILMSATMDPKVFAKYFGKDNGGKVEPCPTLSVPGRTFPVTERYIHNIVSDIESKHAEEFKGLLTLDTASSEFVESELAFEGSGGKSASTEPSPIDWKRGQDADFDSKTNTMNQRLEGLVPTAFIAATIAHICKSSQSGAILTFLPGLQEMTATRDLLLKAPIFAVDFDNEERFKILLLHSAVPPEEQKAVLESVPGGCRKIILSTNIAETSITVPDVKFVVDCGKHREKRYNQTRRISSLECTWIAQSNARQRAGRAGRVREGHYYALYSEGRREHMNASGVPELLRSDLQDTCLAIRAQGFREPLTSFLDEAMQPPSSRAVQLAIENLQAIEALTYDESLTTLGRVLSKLPLHPTMGKVIILGIVFRCLDPLLILGALSGERSLLINTPENRQAARDAHRQFTSKAEQSDHIALLEVFKTLRQIIATEGFQAAKAKAHANFLHFGVFQSVCNTATQIEEILEEVGLVPKGEAKPHLRPYGGESLNVNSNSTVLIRSLLTAGFHPNIGRQSPERSSYYRTPFEEYVRHHPGSQVDLRTTRNSAQPQLFTYSALSKSGDGKQIFMRDSTLIDPLMVILFGGKLHVRDADTIEVDEWLPFKIQNKDATFATKLVLEFRKALDRMFNGAFRALSVDGGKSIANDPINEMLVSAIVALLEKQGHDTAIEVPAIWRAQISG